MVIGYRIAMAHTKPILVDIATSGTVYKMYS